LGSIGAVLALVTQETTGPIAKRLLAIGGGLPAPAGHADHDQGTGDEDVLHGFPSLIAVARRPAHVRMG
jgi:hypothetical protein